MRMALRRVAKRPTAGAVALVPNRYHYWFQFGTIPGVDVNVKGLEPEVVARLSEQAAAEGLSQQEWVRQVLRRTAARLSPAELLSVRATVTPMSEAEFAKVQSRVTTRRRASTKRLDAGRRR